MATTRAEPQARTNPMQVFTWEGTDKRTGEGNGSDAATEPVLQGWARVDQLLDTAMAEIAESQELLLRAHTRAKR